MVIGDHYSKCIDIYIYITLWPIFQIKQEAAMSDNLAKVLQFPEERSKEKNDFISYVSIKKFVFDFHS